MKRLLNISQEERHRILEMHNLSKTNIQEQTVSGSVGNYFEIGGNAIKTLITALNPWDSSRLMYHFTIGDRDEANKILEKYKSKLGNSFQQLSDAVTKGDLSKLASQLYNSLPKLF